MVSPLAALKPATISSSPFASAVTWPMRWNHWGQELLEVLVYLDSLRFVMAESGQLLQGVVRVSATPRQSDLQGYVVYGKS